MNDPIGVESDTYWFAGAHFRLLHSDREADAQEVWFPAGTLTPLHRHTAFSERLFVISGTLEAVIDDRRVPATVGELIEIPIGAVHAVRAGPDGVHLVAMSRPARFAAFVRRLQAPRDQPVDFDRLMAESAAIGDEILGPPQEALRRFEQTAGATLSVRAPRDREALEDALLPGGVEGDLGADTDHPDTGVRTDGR